MMITGQIRQCQHAINLTDIRWIFIPISSFPTVPRYPQLPRRSQRNAPPPTRLGQNVAYPRARPVRNQQSTFQLHQNSQHRQGSARFPRPFDISLAPNETKMEKVLHLPTGQPYNCYTCGQKGHKSGDCLVEAVLDQCGKKLTVDQDTGVVTISDRLPLTGAYKARQNN